MFITPVSLLIEQHRLGQANCIVTLVSISAVEAIMKIVILVLKMSHYLCTAQYHQLPGDVFLTQVGDLR